MTSWLTYRSVVLEDRAQSFIDEHATPGDRIESQWNGVVWLISRKPEVGRPRNMQSSTKYLVFVVAESEIANTQELWVLYSYDDREVVVHAVSFAS